MSHSRWLCNAHQLIVSHLRADHNAGIFWHQLCSLFNLSGWIQQYMVQSRRFGCQSALAAAKCQGGKFTFHAVYSALGATTDMASIGLLKRIVQLHRLLGTCIRTTFVLCRVKSEAAAAPAAAALPDSMAGLSKSQQKKLKKKIQKEGGPASTVAAAAAPGMGQFLCVASHSVCSRLVSMTSLEAACFRA